LATNLTLLPFPTRRSSDLCMDLNQIAMLYRSNAQSRVLEHALFTANLPYRVYGGLRFFERAEIKHALAYLRLIASPDDDTALLRSEEHTSELQSRENLVCR